MSLAGLRSEWVRVYRSAPPGRLSADLLRRGIAHRLQEVAYGGLSAAYRRTLASLAQKPADAVAPASLRPGTRLVRSWRGQTHTVLLLAEGYEYQGERYRSLSQIAGLITGARWSGPRFFGLETAGRAGVHEIA